MNQRPILYFTRILPAYRVPILEQLNKRMSNRLIVCHGQPPKDSSVLMGKTKGNFRQHILTNYWFRNEILHAQSFRRIFEMYESPEVVLVEESPRSITLPWLLHYARRKGAGRVLWGIFYSVFRPFSASNPMQRYRIGLARHVEACACYTKGVRDKLYPHVSPDQLFVAQNTLDTNKLFSLRKELSHQGKSKVKQQLKLPDNEPVFIFAGQLIPRKGTQTLLNVFKQFYSTRPSTLLIMGDGPERSKMQDQVVKEAIPNVHFLGALPKLEESAPYFYAADLMLIPGYVGLVVNHAFSMGLPVITQEGPPGIPFHGPEVESIINGTNGIITEQGNPDALIQAINNVMNNQSTYSNNAANYAERYLTIENMIDGLEAAIRHASELSGN